MQKFAYDPPQVKSALLTRHSVVADDRISSFAVPVSGEALAYTSDDRKRRVSSQRGPERELTNWKAWGKNLVERAGILDVLYDQINNAHKLLSRVNPQSLVRSYLASHPIRKLQVGTGGNYLHSWLNTDLEPKSYRVVKLDATHPFALPEVSFDFIFSEHMIEHIPYRDGVFMLRECHRVLKPRGVVRIATPNLAFLVDLLRPDKTRVQQDYLAWSHAQFDHVHVAEDVFVVNNFVRDWGHQFIYDEKAMSRAFAEAGFQQVQRCELNESRFEDLRGLENEKRSPPGFLRLETLVMEAMK